MFRPLRSPIFLFLVVLMAACSPVPSGDRVLFDFEQEGELDRLRWRCGTLYSLATKHASRGAQSLEMALYPSSYPGFYPVLDVTDWRGYTALSMEIYNPASEALVFVLRVDDEGNPPYEDRYNGHFLVAPGQQTLRLPFDSLVASGSRRPLNLKRIHRCYLFTTSPQTRQVVYLDAVRLEAGTMRDGL